MSGIVKLTADDRARARDGLSELLIACVEDGAFVSFLLPLDMNEARIYWDSVFDEVAAGKRILLAAWQDGRIIGSAQLLLCPYPNGKHRATVQKLLVHPSARHVGLGRALMHTLEAEAKAARRRLLDLDTISGSAAEPLYKGLGYTRVGTIPRYALSSKKGTLEDTVIYYKELA